MGEGERLAALTPFGQHVKEGDKKEKRSQKRSHTNILGVGKLWTSQDGSI